MRPPRTGGIMTALATETAFRPGIYDGMPEESMRTVRVGRGHVAVVDAADYELLARHSWHLMRGHNGKLYAYTTVYMHNLIAETPPGSETDHENGDGLDNRRSNLRHATSSQNRANMWKPRRPDNSEHTSVFKGVNWDKTRSKWAAKIKVNGRAKNLGRHDVEADAARAYDAAALTAWGEFARLNFPVEVAS